MLQNRIVRIFVLFRMEITLLLLNNIQTIPHRREISFIKTAQYLAVIRGLIHYTLGQRRGLGIPSAERLYVCGKCPSDNTVILGKNADLFPKAALFPTST